MNYFQIDQEKRGYTIHIDDDQAGDHDNGISIFLTHQEFAELKGLISRIPLTDYNA